MGPIGLIRLMGHIRPMGHMKILTANADKLTKSRGVVLDIYSILFPGWIQEKK